LGIVKLTFAKNIAYNIFNKKTTYSLIKALSNMYEKSSASNKEFLIRQLVNTKMREGSSVINHVNEFNSLLSILVSINIKFEDDVQVPLLLSSLLGSWYGILGSTSRTTKLTFERIRDLILSKDVRRRNVVESTGSLLSTKSRGRRPERGKGSRSGRSKSKK